MSSLGARIRQQRLGRPAPLKLADLAGSQLSVGLISKIERDLVTPSLPTLALIAERLGVGVASLLDPRDPAEASAGLHSLAAVHDALALLLLGDPAESARVAAQATVWADARYRVRLQGLAAEALFELGNSSAAAALLAEASGGLGAPAMDDQERPLAEAQLSWVLGLLERRRGDAAAAERSWGHCLDVLEQSLLAEPWLIYLRGRVLTSLSDLEEASGSLETARNLHARAAAVLSEVANPAAAARALQRLASGVSSPPSGAIPRAASSLLGTGAASTHGGAGAGAALARGRAGAASIPSGAGAGRQTTCHYVPAIVAALAVTAAASRLLERAMHELARLERAGTPIPRSSRPAEVPHSRHLR